MFWLLLAAVLNAAYVAARLPRPSSISLTWCCTCFWARRSSFGWVTGTGAAPKVAPLASGGSAGRLSDRFAGRHHGPPRHSAHSYCAGGGRAGAADAALDCCRWPRCRGLGCRAAIRHTGGAHPQSADRAGLDEGGRRRAAVAILAVRPPTPIPAGLIPSDFFMDSKLCGECHKDIYEQWKSLDASFRIVQ